MAAKSKSINELEWQLDRDSYEWMLIQHPKLADAIADEVEAGATPQQIKRRVMIHTGRYELAARCEQCARWLERVE